MKFENIMKEAIIQKKKLRVSFYSKEDNAVIERLCAPFDIGPSRRSHDKSNRYHFWDYESDKKNHTLSLLDNQVESITITELSFEPKDIITWDVKKSPWFLTRDWGEYS